MLPLVAPATLASRLGDPHLVILDATLASPGLAPTVSPRERYLAQHLPGAVFFDIDALSDHTSGLPHTLPSAEEFSRGMSALGISDEMEIVVYEQAGVFSAPRARWMLRTFGAQRVSLLDGDLAAWIAAGLLTEAGPVSRPTAVFHAELHREALKKYAEIEGIVKGQDQSSTQILDARSASRFHGAAPEPRAGLSSGHMPGSMSVPFTELLAEGRLRDPQALQALFAAKNVDLDRPITTTCGSGVTAAVVALALELVGAQDVSLYDGSWAEYAGQPGAAIEKE